MTLQGIVKGYHGLIATRVMLGVAEAGFFPAASYLVTTWYCRFEVQRRLSVFYSASALSGAFSGILAYGIQHMVRALTMCNTNVTSLVPDERLRTAWVD